MFMPFMHAMMSALMLLVDTGISPRGIYKVSIYPSIYYPPTPSLPLSLSTLLPRLLTILPLSLQR